MIFEERKTILKHYQLQQIDPAYIELVTKDLWQAHASLGARPIVMLSTLVGAPAAQTYTIVGYENAEAWERLQIPGTRPHGRGEEAWKPYESLLSRRSGYVLSERVRLMERAGPRPKDQIPLDERRDVYGFRRFLIDPADVEEFARLSVAIWEPGGWEASLDSRILGMFHTAGMTQPLAVTLLTGYHSVGHWHETRGYFLRQERDDPEWQELKRGYLRRNNELPISSYVHLMRAHWPE